MPYRRLPNTDAARLRALKKARDKGKELPPFKLAFSQHLLHHIDSLVPRFEQAVRQHKEAMKQQARQNRDYQKKLKKAKLYISHFIQVINMAILREELAPETRTFFNISAKDKRVPALSNENEIIEWGKCIIDGEAARKKKGHSPVTNPTVARLKVHYDHFVEAYNSQKTYQKNTELCL